MIISVTLTKGQKRYGIGVNYGFEQILTWKILDKEVAGIRYGGDYFPMNEKKSIDFYYKLDRLSLISGFSYFNEHCQVARFKGPQNNEIPIDFSSNIIGVPLKIELDFFNTENNIFLQAESEFLFSVFARKIIYDYPGQDTQILESKKLIFHRLVFYFGLGFKIKVVNSLYMKFLADISRDGYFHPILNQNVRFSKYGISGGLLLLM